MIKNLAYELKGINEPVIVLLHGWGMNKSCFDRLVQKIVPNQKILRLDFFGFGESEKPDEFYDTYEYAYQVFLLLSELKINKVILVAHSFGGRVAIILSSIFNINIVSLVLTSSAGINKFSIYKYIKILKYKIIKFFANKKLISNKLLYNCGSKDYKNLKNIDKKIFVKIINQDLKYLLKFIMCKTILVWDKKDKDTPYYICKTLHRNIKNNIVVLYSNGKHFAFMYNINKFSNLINNLLNDNYI